MGEPSKTRLNPAQYDGRFLICLPDQIAVHNTGIVRTPAHLPSRSVGVRLPVLFGDTVMVHHGIHISRCHEEAKSWFSVDADALRIPPVRLRDDSHPVPAALQHPADDRMAERRMIHVRIADNIYKINSVPAARFHIRPADR